MRSTALFILGLAILVFIGLTAYKPSAIADRDWNECVEKYDSKWGATCKNCTFTKDTYRVSLKNICEEKIDVMCCVQEKYKNWKCYTLTELASQDTIIGYACEGTGKYLFWAKKAGDNEIGFPSIEEVNKTYTD